MERITKFLKKRHKLTTLLIVLLLLGIIGFFINRIRIMRYFPNMTSISFDFGVYLPTALVWLGLLGLLYWIGSLIQKRDWFYIIAQWEWKSVLKYSLLLILSGLIIDVFIIVLYMDDLSSFLYSASALIITLFFSLLLLIVKSFKKKKNGNHYRDMMLRYILGLVVFLYAFSVTISMLYGSEFYWSFFKPIVLFIVPFLRSLRSENLGIDFFWTLNYIKPKLSMLLSFYGILYLSTAVILIRQLLKRKITSLLILLIVLNIIGYSHSFYTKIPRTIGGGRFESINIVFKKGYLPNELKTILTTTERTKYDNQYFMYLVHEDDDNYYIVYQREYSEFNKWFHERSSYGLLKPIRDMSWLGRNANIIPKRNVECVIIK